MAELQYPRISGNGQGDAALPLRRLQLGDQVRVRLGHHMEGIEGRLVYLAEGRATIQLALGVEFSISASTLERIGPSDEEVAEAWECAEDMEDAVRWLRLTPLEIHERVRRLREEGLPLRRRIGAPDLRAIRRRLRRAGISRWRMWRQGRRWRRGDLGRRIGRIWGRCLLACLLAYAGWHACRDLPRVGMLLGRLLKGGE